MAARWEETLDHQIDLLKALHSDPGRRYVEGWARSVMGDVEDEAGAIETPTGWVSKATGQPLAHPLQTAQRATATSILHNLPERLSTMTFNADPVYVDPDVMTIIESASAGFQPEPLQATDLITEAGFMWLPRPITITDIRDMPLSYRAILWHPLIIRYGSDDAPPVNGIYLALFHSTDDPDGYPEFDKMARKQGTGRLLLSHVQPWGFGEAYDTSHPRADAGLWGIAKVVQCAWRLMLQTLAVRSEERASGPFRKRWARADMPEKKVTVVRLRRPAQERDPDAEHHAVDWKSRWIVNGHWRNQYFPSLGVHRQIWISPYAKGPEDKPLVLKKTRVFEFVR